MQGSIDELESWSRGGTSSNFGMVWGWRTLSPRWQGLWGGATPADMPFDRDEPLMDKAVVLMTDGTNQFYDWPREYELRKHGESWMNKKKISGLGAPGVKGPDPGPTSPLLAGLMT